MSQSPEDIDECSSSPCHSDNTVRCIDGKNSYTCICKPGFTGINCGKGKGTHVNSLID